MPISPGQDPGAFPLQAYVLAQALRPVQERWRHMNELRVVPALLPAFRGRLLHLRGRIFFLALVVSTLSGCVAIPLNRLLPPLAGDHPCTNSTLRPFLSDPATSGFAFLLPPAVNPTPTETALGHGSNLVIKRAPTFAEFVRRSAEGRQYLPEAIRDHRVTNAFWAIMTKVAAQVQLNAGVSMGLLSANQKMVQQEAIDSFSVPSKLSHSQMKDFADRMFDHQFQPAFTHLVNFSAVPAGGPLDPFVAYFKAYYDGDFIDRMGQSVTKPSFISPTIPINLTIPDSDIENAETVLLEFIIDYFDPTPVLGDAPTFEAITSSTNFYPGASTSEPTALTTIPAMANYQQIQTGCGVTARNIWILTDLANGASDRAAAIDGLVENSFGGFGFSLGVFGKISIGDNQTLSDLVKTAA